MARGKLKKWLKKNGKTIGGVALGVAAAVGVPGAGAIKSSVDLYKKFKESQPDSSTIIGKVKESGSVDTERIREKLEKSGLPSDNQAVSEVSNELAKEASKGGKMFNFSALKDPNLKFGAKIAKSKIWIIALPVVAIIGYFIYKKMSGKKSKSRFGRR